MKRLLSLALAGAIVAGLTACSGSSNLVAGSSIVVGESYVASSINTDVASSADSEAVNAEIANLTTASFYSIDASGELTPNLNFGSIEVVSQKPFTVKYLLTDKAVFSDGQSVTAADLLLSWAAATNLNGANFRSARLGNGLARTVGVPEIGDNNKSITVTFSRPVADFRTAIKVAVPAHSLAQLAFASENLEASQASARVVASIQNLKADDLKALAKAYRFGYQLKSDFKLTDQRAVSSGAYVITEASSAGVTLKANGKNVAMPGARAETIKLVFYSSALQMVADLKAGTLDLATLVPSSTDSNSAIAEAVKAAGSAISSSLDATNTVEALVFNQNKGSSFAASTYGDAADAKAKATAQSLRSAFMNLVSTSKIQTLVGATQTIQDAKSFSFEPSSSFYQSTIQDSGVLSYQFADNQKAYNTVKKFGSRVPVRVLFDTDNPRAQLEYSALAEHAAEVGFGLENIGAADPARVLVSGQYDVYLAPTPLLGSKNAELEQTFGSDAATASDDTFNSLLQEYATAADGVSQAAALKKLDAALIASAYGLPLYHLPLLVASSKKLGKTPDLFGGASLTAGYATWNLAG